MSGEMQRGVGEEHNNRPTELQGNLDSGLTRSALSNGQEHPDGRSWNDFVKDSTETIDDSVIGLVPTNNSADMDQSAIDRESDEDNESNSSTVVGGDADDELSPSPALKRRTKKPTNDSPSAAVEEDQECRQIAEMIKGRMKTKSLAEKPGAAASNIDPLPTIEVVENADSPFNVKSEGKDVKKECVQKKQPLSSIFAQIKGNSPSAAAADETGPTRGRENSVFAPMAKAPMAASAAMVTGLKKWQIRSKSSDLTNTFSKHPTHMADIRENWKAERTRLPFPIMLQIQQEAEPILQNIVRTYKSALGSKHKLTLQAVAKLEQMKLQIHGDGVYT
ncbi:uncharacterized protein [Antedon mediterranea]|uniref:uncharacterized protein isoform X2 n=1 Tax=Antedon mediterranea TaxID=105859 RepID=UPI003AF76D9F